MVLIYFCWLIVDDGKFDHSFYSKTVQMLDVVNAMEVRSPVAQFRNTKIPYISTQTTIEALVTDEIHGLDYYYSYIFE